MALGAEADASALAGADWPALVALATEQGVAALAHDGLQKCYEADPRLSLPLDRELKAVKYDWFGSTLNVEMEYEKQWKAVSSLSKAFAAEGLRTIVLKGFALSSCYPVPQHRYSCDFDCFLVGSGPVTDRSAFEQGNRAMEAAGAKVDRSFYKHSSAKYEDVKVENHLFLVGWRGSRRWKRFEVELEQMLEAPGALYALDAETLGGGTGASGADASGDGALLVGPPLFNALFFIRHAQVHFLIEEGISLRHVCDWAMFLQRYGQELDWPAFKSYCDSYGLSRFAASLTRLAGYVCGISIPSGYALDPAAKSEHGGMANEPPVLRDAKSEHGNVSNEPSVLRDIESEHGNAANEPSVLRNIESEHGGTLFPDDSTSDGLTSAGLTSADSTAADCSSVDRPSAGLTPADRRLLDDILALGKHSSQPKTRLGTALRILRSGWKFRAFSDETPLGCLFRYVWGYFVVRTPKL